MLERYAIALYFAVFTLTSVGYGDIAAQNRVEFFFAAIIIAFGAIFWGYIIAMFCAIVTTSGASELSFREAMDELNVMLADRKLEPELRQRCRAYFHQAKSLRRVKRYTALEAEMSSDLRGAVSWASHRSWIIQLWYLRDAPSGCSVDISKMLDVCIYAPSELMQLKGALCRPFYTRRHLTVTLIDLNLSLTRVRRSRMGRV